MAWIRVIPPEDAEGELADYYEESRAWSQRRRALWGITGRDWTHNPDGNLMSLHPAAARAFLRFSELALYGDGPLSQLQRQMIATVVSANNQCTFCTLRHGRFTRELAQTPALTAQLIRDHRSAPLSDADKAMLDYAQQLTIAPSSIRESTIEDLRRHGFSDRAILDIALIAATFNLVNRVVIGLGRELHAGMTAEARDLDISDWLPHLHQELERPS